MVSHAWFEWLSQKWDLIHPLFCGHLASLLRTLYFSYCDNCDPFKITEIEFGPDVFYPSLLKHNVRSNEAKWPHKSGWIKSHFWLSQPNQACDTIFSIRIWCSTTFSLTVWRNSAKWRFRQFFYPLFCGHLASFFRTSCFSFHHALSNSTE